MNRLQIREMVAVTIGLTEYEHIRDTLCNQLINYSNRKVQMDLLKLGFKGINKKAVYSGSIVDAPADMLAIPNAIIQVKSAIGTRGTASVTLNPNGANNSVCIFSLIEPCIEPTTLTFVSGGAHACTVVGRAVTITYKSTDTIAQLMAFLNEDPAFRSVFLYASASNSGLVPDLQEIVTLTGTGAGWRVTNEVSIEEFEELKTNEFKKPTALSPVYRQVGDTSAIRTLEISPDSTTSALLIYHHRLADMASDTEESPIPAEYEDLLITDVSIRCFGILKVVDGLNVKIPEYTNRVTELTNDYQALLESKFGDKVRLLTDKPND